MSYRPSPWRRVLGTLLLMASAFLVGVGWDQLFGQDGLQSLHPGDPDAAPRTLSPRPELTEEELATIDIFQRASPSVVYITSLSVRRDLFRMNLLEIPRGTGSGFVWNDDGIVVTNYHVIRGADRAQVTLGDHSTWEAELVGSAPEKDLAVLRIDAPAERLHPITIGPSRDLFVGQKVFAIGNPFGLDQSLSTGVISALGREIDSVAGIPIRDVIQTDAAINPGNSGGPLLDSAGRLIGVNTAIFSPSGAYAGIGFAIPADTVNWVVPDLIAFGRIQRPTLGVELVNDAWVRRSGLEGALVLEVVPGSGAEAAELRATTRDRSGKILLGDLIVAIDGEPVTSSHDLVLLLEEREPNEQVLLTIERNGRELEVSVTLGEAR